MGSLDDLLTLQTHDTAADRLRHRRASLPERAELAAREEELAEREVSLADARKRRDEALRQERHLDAEATSLQDKAKAVEKKMYSGTVSSPRELQAMQADVEMLRRHARQLEDDELEVIERREALDAEVAELEAARDAVQAEMERLSAAIAEQESLIDAELAAELAGREGVLPLLPGELVELYEKVRAINKGAGAARLVGDTCQGCHLSIPATEVDRIRHLSADAVARCDNCGCILVR
jgi:predicted  nucleic acid-binding Zn-ribbon protein